jgi:hypothetical protein
MWDLWACGSHKCLTHTIRGESSSTLVAFFRVTQWIVPYSRYCPLWLPHHHVAKSPQHFVFAPHKSWKAFCQGYAMDWALPKILFSLAFSPPHGKVTLRFFFFFFFSIPYMSWNICASQKSHIT